MQGLGINVLFEGNNLVRLLEGLLVTIKISLASVLISMFLGVFLGMTMTIKNKVIQVITRIYLEAVRIIPQLVLLFIFYFGVTKALGVDLSGEVSAILVFTIWGTAEMGDLVRSALISIPIHQYESAKAIGLNKLQIYYYVIIPQAMKRLIPNAINLTTRMIKTTSLIALIGVIEVIKVAQQIIDSSRFNYPTASLWLYGLVFFLYFIVCYPISLLAKRLELKWKN